MMKNNINTNVKSKVKIVKGVVVGSLSVVLLSIGISHIQVSNAEKTIGKVNCEENSRSPQIDMKMINKLNNDGYEKQSVESFNEKISENMDEVGLYIQSLGEKDLKKPFNQSLKYSFDELQFEKDGEDAADIGITVGVDHNVDTDNYYGAALFYALKWKVDNKANITVEERDNTLNQYQTSVKEIIDNKSKNQLLAKNAKKKITNEIDSLSTKLSTKNITVYANVSDYQVFK